MIIDVRLELRNSIELGVLLGTHYRIGFNLDLVAVQGYICYEREDSYSMPTIIRGKSRAVQLMSFYFRISIA